MLNVSQSSKAVKDVYAYRRTMVSHGRAAGLTPAQLATSGLDIEAARPWQSEEPLKGTLLARTWSPDGSRLTAYIDGADGDLCKATLWRGSDPYRQAVILPMGAQVTLKFTRSASGRVYCSIVTQEN